MKKTLVLLTSALLILVLCACGAISSDEANNTAAKNADELSVEEAYDSLIDYASSGNYLEGYRVGLKYPSVLKHEDGQAYYDFCIAMMEYEEGAIGNAYNSLLKVSHLPEAQSIIETLNERVGSLNGYYVADSGMGSYKHIVIRDGLVASEIIGYFDEEQTFNYTDDDFRSSIVTSKYNDGTEFIAIGHNYVDLTVEYVINVFEDSNELMIIKYEGYEFDTFNGLYSKVAEV